MILCYFSSRYISIAVKEVLDILTIEPEEMQSSAEMHELTTFIAKVRIRGKERLCTIFDTDRLLHDIFGSAETSQSKESQMIESSKYLLFADDSLLVRKMAQKSFEEIGVHYKIYEDGLELIEALSTLQTQDIGLFLLDLEMPRKSGLDVIDFLIEAKKYSEIPIIVHTNMANTTIAQTLNNKGVTKIIHKIDFTSIKDSIRDYMA